MVAGNAIMAYRTAAIVIAFCFIGFQLLTVFGVKERKRPEKKRTLSLKDMFHIFLRNDQLIVIPNRKWSSVFDWNEFLFF